MVELSQQGLDKISLEDRAKKFEEYLSMCESENNDTVIEQSPGSKYEGEDILEKELENQ